MRRVWRYLLLSLVRASVVWGAILLAGIIASFLPGEWRVLPILLPIIVIVCIGMAAVHHWWTWGSLLIPLPLVVFGLYCLVEVFRSPPGTRYHSYAVGFAIAGLVYGLALGVVVVALTGLGVVLGQRRQRWARSDLVSAGGADLLAGSWALGEGTAADGARLPRCSRTGLSGEGHVGGRQHVPQVHDPAHQHREPGSTAWDTPCCEEVVLPLEASAHSCFAGEPW